MRLGGRPAPLIKMLGIIHIDKLDKFVNLRLSRRFWQLSIGERRRCWDNHHGDGDTLRLTEGRIPTTKMGLLRLES